MKLLKLEMRNFRNYLSQVVAFHPRLNIIYGANAQGKTNLLEAVYFTLVGRSFRAARDVEMIHWEYPHFFLRGELHGSERHFLVESGCNRSGRLQLKVDGVIEKKAHFLFRFPAVFFGPEDLLLIKEGPDRRRRFLNLEGSRLRPHYYNLYREYYRTLQQRNRLLRRGDGGRPAHMEPWNDLLVKYGSRVIRERISLLQALEEQCSRFFSFITDMGEKVSLEYSCSFDYGGDLERLESCYRQTLARITRVEERRGSTLAGPHLDDFCVLINGRDARRFASQGQQRTAALALKMGEVFLFEVSSPDSPVVLLDDVLSEFDQQRQDRLLRFLRQRAVQTMITTALPVDRLPHAEEDRCSFTVTEGKVSGGNPRPSD